MEDNKVNLNQAGLMNGGEGTTTIIREEQDAECLTCHRPWQEGIKITVSNIQEARKWWEHGQESDMTKPEPEVRGILIRDIAGQEEEIEPENEMEIPKAELEDGDNKEEIVTGYDPGMPAVETDSGMPNITDTAAMVK